MYEGYSSGVKIQWVAPIESGGYPTGLPPALENQATHDLGGWVGLLRRYICTMNMQAPHSCVSAARLEPSAMGLPAGGRPEDLKR